MQNSIPVCNFIISPATLAYTTNEITMNHWKVELHCSLHYIIMSKLRSVRI